jgi:hypothetical protein
MFGVGAHCEQVAYGPGALVILDPQECRRVGEYEILFFPGDASHHIDPAGTSAVRMPITPWSRITMKPPSHLQIAAHGVKDGPHAYTVQFHTDTITQDFLRDFEVRRRVMELSRRAAHVGSENRQALVACPSRFLLYLVVPIVGVLVSYAVYLSREDPFQQPLDVVSMALDDAWSVTSSIGNRAMETTLSAGISLCGSLVQGRDGIPISHVQQCLALPDNPSKVECFEALAPTLPGSGDQPQAGQEAHTTLLNDFTAPGQEYSLSSVIAETPLMRVFNDTTWAWG